MEAMKLLFGVDVIPVAGGGIDGAEGCKVFLLEGDNENVELAFEVLSELKGEPTLSTSIMDKPKDA
jgi:hypothetical protein